MLINASPDVLTQLRVNLDLQPARTLRDTALEAILLTDAQIDHTTGLFMLREATQPWPLWCTDSVAVDLAQGNPILGVLEHFCKTTRHSLPIDRPFEPVARKGLLMQAHAVKGKPPPFSPNRETPQPGDNIALTIRETESEAAVFYAPGLGEIDAVIWQRMREAHCVMVDGTFWTDDELPSQGIGTRTARDMGHLPLDGPGGMIEWLDGLPDTTRKVLIHINNTNPILDSRSPERRLLDRHGIEVAYDGMEIAL